ncbi:MAG: class I SAM-dependent methyltransferase, partial [Solirubrobacteraceae bacterium]
MSITYTPSRFHVVHTAPAWMPPYERVVLHGLTVGLAPRQILEIGTFQGGSTLIMCAALDDLGEGRIVCVDPHPRLADDTW